MTSKRARISLGVVWLLSLLFGFVPFFAENLLSYGMSPYTLQFVPVVIPLQVSLNFSSNFISNQIFHYNTRCITPKCITSLGASTRHCARATKLFPKKYRIGGELLVDLTGLKFEPQISRFRDERFTARPIGQYNMILKTKIVKTWLKQLARANGAGSILGFLTFLYYTSSLFQSWQCWPCTLLYGKFWCIWPGRKMLDCDYNVTKPKYAPKICVCSIIKSH